MSKKHPDIDLVKKYPLKEPMEILHPAPALWEPFTGLPWTPGVGIAAWTFSDVRIKEGP